MHHIKLTYELNTTFEWLAFQHCIQDILDLLLDPEPAILFTASCAFLQFLPASGGISRNMQLLPSMFFQASLLTVTLPLTYDYTKVSLNNYVPTEKQLLFQTDKNIPNTLTIRMIVNMMALMQWQRQKASNTTGSQVQLSNQHYTTANEWMNHIIYTPEIKYKTVTRFMLCNTKLV